MNKPRVGWAQGVEVNHHRLLGALETRGFRARVLEVQHAFQGHVPGGSRHALDLERSRLIDGRFQLARAAGSAPARFGRRVARHHAPLCQDGRVDSNANA